MNSSKNIFLFLFCFIVAGLSSQTSEQARYFVNRTHIALAKVQKEMYRSGKNDQGNELKDGLKFQTVALKMYKDRNFEKAVGYSYKAREVSLTLLNTLSKHSVEALSPDNDEKTFCKPGEYKNLDTKNIDKSKAAQIDQLNVLDPLKFRDIELNIKQQ
jgi:hypothetical protein